MAKTLKQIMNTKAKPSKFFEYFVNKYGPTASKTAPDEEIYKNLRLLYLDLAFGNIINNEKYINYLQSDMRTVEIALTDSYQHMMEAYIILESLKFASANNFIIILQNQQYFEFTNKNADSRYFTYSTIYKGLFDFYQTQDPSKLIFITASLSNPMNRNIKPILL